MDMTFFEDESPQRCCNLFWMKLYLRDSKNISEWLIKLKITLNKNKLQIFILYNQCLGEKAWWICKFVIGLEKKCTTVVI